MLKFIPDKGIIKRYTEQEGLPNNVVYGILPDSSGNLWLSTNKGISKFNTKEETFENYFMVDGLPSDEFNVGAFLKASSGKFYFGSINGIVSFYPEENKSNSY
ncbi:MAG TPA: two-component regulator propeller domain-containing protein, partial [Ignavibacteriaceae bacterium]|nr:two-component regulator propeller domain-containing protein [Ignavibacteriaceae bacterium]